MELRKKIEKMKAAERKFEKLANLFPTDFGSFVKRGEEKKKYLEGLDSHKRKIVEKQIGNRISATIQQLENILKGQGISTEALNQYRKEQRGRYSLNSLRSIVDTFLKQLESKSGEEKLMMLVDYLADWIPYDQKDERNDFSKRMDDGLALTLETYDPNRTMIFELILIDDEYPCHQIHSHWKLHFRMKTIIKIPIEKIKKILLKILSKDLLRRNLTIEEEKTMITWFNSLIKPWFQKEESITHEHRDFQNLNNKNNNKNDEKNEKKQENIQNNLESKNKENKKKISEKEKKKKEYRKKRVKMLK